MIDLLSSKIPVRFLCKYFSVNPSSYYYWKKGLQERLQSLSQEGQSRALIREEIKKAFKASKETYGSPRIYQELRSKKIPISENTVAKYMRDLGLDARLKKKFKIQTTDSNHPHPIAPRLFKVEDENPIPSAPHKILAGDITYLKYDGDKFLFLAVVLDVFNREVVGWSMGESLETGLVLKALASAMVKVGPDAEVIFHSDRGCQYASEAYRKFLKNKEIVPSMSRKGNCYDNAYVESWFASLKKEWIYRRKYFFKEDLRAAVFEYIETWYNSKRRHSSLGYLSPMEYKIKQQQIA